MSYKLMVTKNFAEAWKKAHGSIPDHFLIIADKIETDVAKEVEERLNIDKDKLWPIHPDLKFLSPHHP